MSSGEAARYNGFSTFEDERLACICPNQKIWKIFYHFGRYAIAFTLIGILRTHHLCVRDNHTLGRGLLYCYKVIGIPEPLISNDAMRPRTFSCMLIEQFTLLIIK